MKNEKPDYEKLEAERNLRICVKGIFEIRLITFLFSKLEKIISF